MNELSPIGGEGSHFEQFGSQLGSLHSLCCLVLNCHSVQFEIVNSGGQCREALNIRYKECDKFALFFLLQEIRETGRS